MSTMVIQILSDMHLIWIIGTTLIIQSMVDLEVQFFFYFFIFFFSQVFSLVPMPQNLFQNNELFTKVTKVKKIKITLNKKMIAKVGQTLSIFLFELNITWNEVIRFEWNFFASNTIFDKDSKVKWQVIEKYVKWRVAYFWLFSHID